MKRVVLPGATIGVLGSGQLGRMFTIAARRMGYRVHVLSPDNDTPTGQVADIEWHADYLDLDALTEFARSVDVVTFEFENIPNETTQVVDRQVPVRPAGSVLHTSQNRIREKRFLQSLGVPVAPFREIHASDDLHSASLELPGPAILKTAAWGYDGKGQVRIESPADADTAWAHLQCQEAVWEQFVDFESELSVVAARALNGDYVCYAPSANRHCNQVLDISMSPAILPERVAREAQEIARSILEALEVVGVLCVEFFLKRDGQLCVNELAPRPHNSGHLTIDAHASCQFEQQVRAVCGLPLGSVQQWSPAAMANLLGDIWLDQPPAWEEVLREPNIKLHLYGKREPRGGRKMGHLTALAESPMEAMQLAVTARERLSRVKGNAGNW